ncbi:MAG: nitroreductase family deazaflavin-dependent oxidoreductase [Acidimicrobiia bacterium]
MRDSAVRRWSRFHAVLYRTTAGRLGHRLVGNDMLLLTTTGRVSGRRHTVPLLYLRDGDRLVVIASYGGRPSHPTWYDNLVADEAVQVQIDGSHVRMRARTATEPERAAWWPRIESAYEGYAVYQSRTDRVIPVVFLEPRDGAQDQSG